MNRLIDFLAPPLWNIKIKMITGLKVKKIKSILKILIIKTILINTTDENIGDENVIKY